MNKGTIKAAVLSIIFILSIFICETLMNHTNEDLTTEMQDATLPVISLYANETEINQLHGYSVEMNAAYMRDTITPIDESRILPLTIQTYQTEVDAVSYEIRSLDASRLIANAEVDSYEKSRGKITAELQIQNLLEDGEEYLLIIRLESGDKSIYYYTRIMKPVDCYVNECMEFVTDFNAKTFNEETVGTLATYMEKTTGDNTSLQYVTLNSSLSQLGWADFKGKRLTEIIPSIKEITDTYNVFTLNYVVTSIGETGESEYYNVEEYYRVRYTSRRIYLLNFERTMNQIFRGENHNIYENAIQLGIRSADVEYKINESGNSISFVQEGELWSYNLIDNTLAKAFSFRGYEGIDNRENYGEHGIKIVDVDEAGSVDFIVYGYMNRGIHEGQVGIAVYHYDSLSNTNEEEAFIPSDKSYEVMKSELGQLMYANEGGELFLMLDGTVYGIDLNTLKIQELVTGLTDEAFAVSKSNRYFAWIDAGEVNSSGSIHVLNLSNCKTTDIEAPAGTYLKPLGFMEEDFVYGVASKTDVFVDAAGNTIFPMAQIKIADVSSAEMQELKTYQKTGYFISGIEIIDYTMYLNRIQYNGTAYVEADRDMIMDKEGDGGNLVSLNTTVSEEKKTQWKLTLTNELSEKSPKLLTPKETILENDRTVALTDENSRKRYYVYVKGDVVLTTDDVTEAVIKANEQMGVVIGDDLRYIWKRSRKAVQSQLTDISVGAEDENSNSIAQSINAMLEKEGININVGALIARGETPKAILNNTMTDMQVLDLTGCTVDEILYYVSCGSPVFAMTGSQSAVLVVGYDANNIIIFDPEQKTTYRRGIEEANELFAVSGNVFFTYLEK